MGHKKQKWAVEDISLSRISSMFILRRHAVKAWEVIQWFGIYDYPMHICDYLDRLLPSVSVPSKKNQCIIYRVKRLLSPMVASKSKNLLL